MNSDLSRPDLLLIDRYLDGALRADELTAARIRLEAEPALRIGLQERMQLRRGFEAGRGAVYGAPDGFAAGVVAAARRLPIAEDAVETVSRLCRRIVFAAAAIVLAAVLWQSGLFHERGNGTLQAAPDEAARIIDALDAKIHARPVDGARK